MRDTRIAPIALLLLSLGLFGGCASQCDCIAVLGPAGLTPATVGATGQGQGTVVTWGGVIASMRNQQDATEIEVIAYRLDDCGKPATSGPGLGRFIARHSGFLEPTDHRIGRRVSATGRIGQARDGRIGEAPYRFAVLDGAVVHLWPDETTGGETGWMPVPRPWISIGVGSGGYRGVGGGIGIGF